MAVPFDTVSADGRLPSDSEAEAVVPDYGCDLSLTRVVLVAILSIGLYWFCWMDRTRAQYHDHTVGAPEQVGQTNHPVWHGLTQLVPEYGFFHFRARIRLYQSFLQERSVIDGLNVTVLVAVVVINSVVAIVGGGMRGDSVGPGVTTTAGIGYLITLISLLVGVWVIYKVQSNLNDYWATVGGTPARSARFGKGEILCLFIGILFWLGVIADFIVW